MPPVRDRTNGVTYKMHRRNEHPRAHLHLTDGSGAAVIALDTLEVLAGRRMHPKKLSDALEWIAKHQDELLQMWQNRMQADGIYKIED